jgi:hypothetical protein
MDAYVILDNISIVLQLLVLLGDKTGETQFFF